MKNCLISTIVISLLFTACKSSKVEQSFPCSLNSKEIQFKSSLGYPSLKNYYQRYFPAYQKMIRSLKLSSKDTVALFIRPCYTHTGLAFVIYNKKLSTYYFDFSENKNTRILALKSDCQLVEDFFEITSEIPKTYDAKPDDIVVTPPCPIDIFFKLNSSFYYRSIVTAELITYSDKQMVLINACDNILKSYRSIQE